MIHYKIKHRPTFVEWRDRIQDIVGENTEFSISVTGNRLTDIYVERELTNTERRHIESYFDSRRGQQVTLDKYED